MYDITTGLDASTASNVMNCLKKLAEEGRESFHTTGAFEKKNLTCCLETQVLSSSPFISRVIQFLNYSIQ
jgi:ABC-type multidrug transport system ATPase subunit